MNGTGPLSVVGPLGCFLTVEVSSASNRSKQSIGVIAQAFVGALCKSVEADGHKKQGASNGYAEK